MNIGTVNINITHGQSSVARAFIAAMLRSPETGESESIDEPIETSHAVPQIGEYWQGQGGIYAGMCRGLNGERDYPLILFTEITETERNWKDSLDASKEITVNGQQDFHVPTKEESALLYANLKDKFDADVWYWTSTQSSDSNAWIQSFYGGVQYDTNKSSERRCCFVRRLVL
jgi:hypothetical protein